MPKPNDPAPSFSLPSTSGGAVASKDLKGRRYVLYFYPKDDTPGCTREACGFRDHIGRLGKAGVPVYGVSKDSLASHARFRAKYGLPFHLLSDADNAVAKAWGAFGKKIMYGKPVVGTIRSTFLVGANGRIERVWSPVKVDGHVDEVLAAVAEGAGVAAPARERARKVARKPAGKTTSKTARKASVRPKAAGAPRRKQTARSPARKGAVNRRR